MCGTSKLVRCVVIIRLGFFTVGADELIAAYVADGVVVSFFTDYLITIKDKGYEPAIFLQFCPKSLAVIAVLLDVSVTVPVTCKNPCKICFANGFLPYCTTLFHGLSSKCQVLLEEYQCSFGPDFHDAVQAVIAVGVLAVA